MLSKVQASARRPAIEPRSLVILGATGSIGRSAADVLDAAPGTFHVEAVAACRDAKGLAAVARRLSARFAAICEPGMYAELKAELSGSGVMIAAGNDAVVEAARRPADLVLGAIAGAAGVEPTYAALSRGRTIALANKECLVCAGAPFMRKAAEVGARLLPVDSEHNAIFQALGGEPIERVERMTLTASGGPFRTWTASAIGAATPEQALAHPNWSMGRKVTIDSATLMNKGLELIEAYHIFGIAADRLDVLVHPQSIVHGLVSFADGSVTAGLAVPDMKVPIAHCLGFPIRLSTPTRRLDLAAISTLTFEHPDFDRFPALKVAMDALKSGGGMPTVLNAANEIAVEAFLDRRIGFADIARFVAAACEAALADGTAKEPQSVGEALAVDHIVRERSRSLLARTSRSGMVTLQ
jgi:1-deoxy-D-xylulose-5-phosphate reductoisomerase